MTTLQDPADRTAAQARWPGRPRHPVLRVLAMAGVFLCALTAFLLGAIYIICKGPSPAARDLFVHTVMETSAAKFTARIFLSEEAVSYTHLQTAFPHKIFLKVCENCTKYFASKSGAGASSVHKYKIQDRSGRFL